MENGPATNKRLFNRLLIAGAIVSLILGLVTHATGGDFAHAIWTSGTVPVIAALVLAIWHGFKAGRAGLDTIAFLSMSTALVIGEALAANVVAIMYAGGAVLEDYAVSRAERDLTALIDRAPRIAHRLVDAHIEDIPVDQIRVGDQLVVRSGEILPADGVVANDTAILDEAALTGEPMPVTHFSGDAVRSGCVNAGETFHLCASAIAGESTYAGILRLVSAAQTARAPFLRLADRMALLLLPASLALAGGAWFFSGDVVRALAVLVSATPCPLILAAPVAFIAGVSRAARLGILVKGGGPLEALANVRTIIFDKTGTLTVGGARLLSIETAPDVSAHQVLRLAAALEQASHHVIAASIIEAAKREGLDLPIPIDAHEAHGAGLDGVIEGRRIRIGSHHFVFGDEALAPWAQDVLQKATERAALAVFVAADGQALGALLMGDELRADAPRAVQRLRQNGVQRILMLTGDRADAAAMIGSTLDLDLVLADCTPAEKLEVVSAEQKRAQVLMVGDGINDAPALAIAHVGMAMGARGASASSQAADIVVLVDQIGRVADAFAIARRTRNIAWQSIGAGMAFSGAAMIFAAFGFLSPIEGALLQEAIDVAVILNALRALAAPVQA